MQPAVQNMMVPLSHGNELNERAGAADYIAAMTADLAAIARSHGLDTLGYVLDMARLEAQNVSRPGSGRS
jgi:hypothetical protein